MKPMKTKAISLILLALLLMPSYSAAPDEVSGIVTDVVDGDTIHVQIQGCDSRIGNISVRLADIDCPELNTTAGPAARQYTFRQLNGSLVGLDLDDRTGKDRFCRWVAVVFLPGQNGTLMNFNRMIVEAGHACIWDFENNEFDPALWWNGTSPGGGLFCTSSGNKPAGPQEAKSNSSSSSSGLLLGNAASGKYHLPDCEWAGKIDPENRIWFNSSEQARSMGYVPCKACHPA